MKLVVIGAGIMGHGIAQLGTMAGHEVMLTDLDDARLEHAEKQVGESLAKLASKERLDEPPAAVRARLSTSTELERSLRDANAVIEAVPEILELKQEILGQAASAAASDALIATNSSQLSITEIGAALGPAADRLVGMHFFNPPVLMRLCELVRGYLTSDGTLAKARALAEAMGKEVVVCKKDTPGFITTRAYAALRQECIHMLEEGIATAEDIDKALRLGFNFPMGPLELSDFNGVDTYLHVVTALSNAYGERFRPPATVRNMVAAGRLGRKTGAGFYEYSSDG